MSQDEVPAPEGIRLSSETIPIKEFFKRYGGDEPDPRFVPSTRAFGFTPLMLDPEETGSYCSLLKLNDLVVGVAELLMSAAEPSVLRLEAISNLKGLRRSDSKEEREMKLSERLLREVFRFAKAKKLAIRTYAFMPEGHERLVHQLPRLAKEYEVMLAPGTANPTGR